MVKRKKKKKQKKKDPFKKFMKNAVEMSGDEVADEIAKLILFHTQPSVMEMMRERLK
ncbi:MAG: hypothetical protein K2M42_09265 [Oscillospiraceae bacterium]|nr:hypothetical protein [Oscillospiraceae bacterium]